MVPYRDIESGEVLGEGLMCLASSDETFKKKWGPEHWEVGSKTTTTTTAATTPGGTADVYVTVVPFIPLAKA